MDTRDFSPALIDVLGIEDFTKSREFGRERGLNPVLSEMSKKNLEELTQRLNYSGAAPKPKKGGPTDDDEDIAVTFDIKSEPRVVLNKGYISTKSYNSLVPHNQRRYAYLLNDVLLITSPPSASFSLFSEKLNIYHVIYLDSVSFIDLRLVNPSEDPCAFALRTSERPFHILAESEMDKKIWLEELEAAIFCIFSSIPNKQLGWNHEILLGTIYSAAMLGEVDLLNKHISRLIGQSLDTPDDSGMTALHWASLYGNAEAVQVLLDNGADVDCLNSGLNTALMIACACGHDAIAHMLINKNADVFIRNMKGSDCLTLAVLYGGACPGLRHIITALQSQGVDLNKMDSLGATPLHECASRSLSEPVQVLVDAGADVNIKNQRNGLTPLQMACSATEPDPITVESFLQKGAHPNWKDTAKRSAFDIILQTQRNVPTRTGKGHTKEAISQLAPFVQAALTSCLFLVRKGARFTDESIQHLKPSFQDLLKSERAAWERLTEHQHFGIYIEANKANLKQPKDMADNESDHCLLCVDKFTMSNRRHHCRGCGILVCMQCSTKRLLMTPMSSKNSANAKPDRVCDGCFNRLSYEAMTWIQNERESARQRVEESFRQADAELAANQAASTAAKKKKKSTLSTFYRPSASFSQVAEPSAGRLSAVATGSFDDRSSMSAQQFSGDAQSPSKSKSFSAAIVTNSGVDGGSSIPPKAQSFSVRPATTVVENNAQLQNTLNDTRNALDERGQRLNDLAERTDAMNQAAGDFLTNARKLKEQQKRAMWNS